MDGHPAHYDSRADEKVVGPIESLNALQILRIGFALQPQISDAPYDISNGHAIDGSASTDEEIEQIRPTGNRGRQPRRPGDQLEQDCQRPNIVRKRCEQMRADRQLPHQFIESSDDLIAPFTALRDSRDTGSQRRQIQAR
jgi:hypothetical protein